jgi:hypothetical protein
LIGVKKMNWFSVILALAILFPGPSLGAETPQTDAMELMNVSGAANIARDLAPLIARQLVAAMRRSNSALPERVNPVTTEVVTTYLNDPVRSKELIDQLAAVYLRTFSPVEIKELITFYKTPVGKKLVLSLPTLASQSAQIGQAWARKMMPGAHPGYVRPAFPGNKVSASSQRTSGSRRRQWTAAHRPRRNERQQWYWHPELLTTPNSA